MYTYKIVLPVASEEEEEAPGRVGKVVLEVVLEVLLRINDEEFCVGIVLEYTLVVGGDSMVLVVVLGGFFKAYK